ncbi:MAG: hypothetical protein ACLVEU_02655 [Bacteroides cellulosilyticus]
MRQRKVAHAREGTTENTDFASQNNALTFFVGAGVSALSGAPTWKRLVHGELVIDWDIATKENEYSSDEYLQIPQMFYYSLGENKEEYYTFVKALQPRFLRPCCPNAHPSRNAKP